MVVRLRLISRTINLAVKIIPDRYLIPVGLVVGTIVMTPMFVFFYAWKKLDPEEYRKKFETEEAIHRIETFDDHIL